MAAESPDQQIHASLSGVTRIYPGAAGTKPVHALGPVDLDLKRGEFFAVVGPSGCGKSTLLEVLAGLQPPTAGSVTCRTASASCSRRMRASPGSPCGTTPPSGCVAKAPTMRKCGAASTMRWP